MHGSPPGRRGSRARARRPGTTTGRPEQRRAHAGLPELGFARRTSPSCRSRPANRGAKGCSTSFKARIDRTTGRVISRRARALVPVGHLRFGTVSVRELVRPAVRCTPRAHRLARGTHLARTLPNDPLAPPARREHACARNTNAIVWETGPHADAAFAAWCEGRTLSAGRCRDGTDHQTGYMHKPARMVVASFLTKDLRHRLASRRTLLRRPAQRL